MSKVYPVHYNEFQVNAGTSETPSWVGIANLTSFEVNLDPVIDSWYSFEMKGWQSNMKVGFAGTITTELKRTYGDVGNDLLFETVFSLDPDVVVKQFKWTWPDGTVVTFDGLVSLETVGGETASVETSNLTIYINGQPTVTEPEGE